MSIWAQKQFLLSCDVQLDLKVYVGTLQLREAASPSWVEECYVSLQVVDGGIPLHPFARSTGLSYTSGGRLAWDEWVALPVKVKDVPERAQLLVKLWGVGNVCLGGGSLRLFDKSLAFRRGQVPLVVWRRDVDAAATLSSADVSGEAPLSLLLRPDRSHLLVKFLEAYARDRGLEREVRDGHLRDGRPDLAAQAQVCNVNVPSSPWTDRMLATALQQELLAAGAESSGSASPAASSRLLDAFHVGVVALNFPLLPYPILFEDAVYGPVGLGSDEAGLGSDPLQPRMPPVVLQTTSAGAAMLSPEAATADAAGQAYWGEQLMVIWDPEDDAGLDNPSDVKYHKLVRAGTQGAGASAIKPTRAELAKIQAVVAAPDPTGIGAKPSQEAADLLWRLRYSLTGNKRALVKFAQVVDWGDEAEAGEAATLLASWAPIDLEDALRLLCPEFSSPIPRAHAVASLRRTSDEDVLLYLLQLVQALRYEPGLPAAAVAYTLGSAASRAAAAVATAPGSPFASADGSAAPTLPVLQAGKGSVVEQEVLTASPLASFLIERACSSPQVALSLHWTLAVATDDPRLPAVHLFTAVAAAFNAALQSTPERRAIAEVRDAQVLFLAQVARARDEATSSKKDGVKAKIEKLNAILGQNGPFPDVVSMQRPLPLPCAPGINVCGVVAGGCHMFKSALYPTVITFKVHPSSRALDWQSDSCGMCGLTVSAAAQGAANRHRQFELLQMTGAGTSRSPSRLMIDSAPSSPLSTPRVPQHLAHSVAVPPSSLADAVASACLEEPAATYRVIFKQGDDLRQDALIIQLLRICDAQLKRVGLDLHLTPYSVVATGKETGMMEMVLGSLPVSAVLENSAYARGSQGPVQAYLKETNPYEGAGTSVPSPRPSHSPPRLL